jgi:hypothetical protein
LLSHKRNIERPVETWNEIKTVMSRQFIHSHYYKELYQKLQWLGQGTKYVDKNHKKTKIMMVRANIMKDKKAIIAKFLNGLNPKITNIIELKHFMELKDMMLHIATRMEGQLKHDSSSRPSQLLGSSST